MDATDLDTVKNDFMETIKNEEDIFETMVNEKHVNIKVEIESIVERWDSNCSTSVTSSGTTPNTLRNFTIKIYNGKSSILVRNWHKSES